MENKTEQVVEAVESPEALIYEAFWEFIGETGKVGK